MSCNASEINKYVTNALVVCPRKHYSFKETCFVYCDEGYLISVGNSKKTVVKLMCKGVWEIYTQCFGHTYLQKNRIDCQSFIISITFFFIFFTKRKVHRIYIVL